MLYIILSLTLMSTPQNTIDNSDVGAKFKLFDHVLSSYTNQDGTVDYTSIQKNPFNIDEFLSFIGRVSPENHPELFQKDDAKAYWINVYNALAIKTIIDNPGIESIRDISWGMGAFWRNNFLVGGKKITLNFIEKKMLRNKYKDPRIHFAINCASNSCPPIGNRIVSGNYLDDQLNKKAIDFINAPTNVNFNYENKTVSVSRIFKWFKNDFLIDNDSLIEYILKYRTDISIEKKVDIAKNYKITFLKYDWALND